MSKIKILAENIINKIAAGEVVQRPESVVKELMENSIDAGSSSIDVIIRDAGKSLIQVADDGSGMSEEDALLAFQRHATSKISRFEDLSELQSYGFRGEALSSISGVSLFEIKTEKQDEEIGTHIRVENGTYSVEKGSFSKGTSITVKNLFFNVPARRNFLKTNATEMKHITETFRKIALSHPEMAFRMFNDDELIYDYKKCEVEKRVAEVFGEEVSGSVIPAKENTDLINVTGFLAKPAYLRKNKGDQYLYINRRFVSSRIINHAVFSAYENLIEKGDYPFFILFLELNPAKVDVNVHPSKLEVKFDDEKSIYSLVHAIVRKSLGSYDLTPVARFTGSEGDPLSRMRIGNDSETIKRPINTDYNTPSFKPPKRPITTISDEELDLLFSGINDEIKKAAPEHEVPHPFQNQPQKDETEILVDASEELILNTPFIVSLHNKYILTPIKSGVMIIDQHIAHERILYERALKFLYSDSPISQQLLFPETINLDPGDMAVCRELLPQLRKLGFDLRIFTGNSIVIDGVPPEIKVGQEKTTLLDILEEYKKNQIEKSLEIRDNLAKSYSCKTAIKAGDRLEKEELVSLVEQLFATSMPYVCPHGRPVMIKLPLTELDRRFGRTS